MRAGDVDRVDRCRRSDIRIKEGWADDGSHEMRVAVARQWRRIAVSDSKSRDTLFSGALYGIDRVPEALPEADSHKYILRGQDLHLVLQCSGAARRRLR